MIAKPYPSERRLIWLVVFALLCALTALVATPAKADSWTLPTTAVYASPNGVFRLTVEPSPLDSQLEYFSEESEAAAEGKTVERVPPMALLERRDGDAWVPVWARPLINHVAPVEAMVADNGRMVTFDNWHSVGYGPDVVVIYDGSGNVLRALGLADLVPPAYIEALPHSTSSLSWRKGARLDPEKGRLLIDLLVPGPDTDEPSTVEFAISLTTGEVSLPPPDAWQAALAASEAETKAREQREAARIAYLAEPIAVPPGAGERDWHEYLREAFYRLTPDFLDSPVPSTTVLFAPSNKRFRESVQWLVEGFEDEQDFPGSIMIGSPASPTALIDALAKASKAVPPGSLESTIYVSVDAEHRGEAERLVRSTGARFVWLDPTATIPQRPERIEGSPEQKAADEERFRRQRAEMNGLLDELEAD